MKTAKLSQLKSLVIYFIAVLMAFVFFQSCAPKMEFMNSSVVPAAEGSVKIKSDKNGNYTIELKVIRLAEPSRLNSHKDVYVVWMKTEKNGIKNIGELKTSDHILSKVLKSSLKTVTSFKPSGFFITAENNADISEPAGQVVLNTEAK